MFVSKFMADCVLYFDMANSESLHEAVLSQQEHVALLVELDED